MKTKTVIYARVSSREQEETGYSLDAQEKLLREYSEKKDYEVVRVFRITESASGKQIRKTFGEMLQYTVKNDIHILLCEKIDRLTRNLKDAAIVSDWIHESDQNEVHFVKENFIVNKNTRAHENLVWDMKVAIARFYTNNLSEEVKKGQKEKLLQGWLPTRPPLGYRTVGEKGHKTHVIDEKTGPLIKKMFEYEATGNYSLSALSQKMYDDGLRSRSGGRIARSQYEELVKDPFYYGVITWKQLTYAGRHEPLISKELFDNAQNVLTRKSAPHYKTRSFIFSKMMKCGECDGTISGEIQKGHVYYGCKHHGKCSQKGGPREESVENQLIGVMKFFQAITPKEAEQIKSKIKQDHSQEIEYKEKVINSHSERYGILQKRLDHLYNDRLDEKISSAFWEKKQKEITDEQAQLLEQINKLKSEEAKYFEIWLNILDLSRRAAEIYSKRSPEEKRLLLSCLFSNLTLKDKNVAYTLKKPVAVLAQRIQEKIDSEKLLEPKKTLKDKRQKDSFESLHPALLLG